MGNLLRWLQPDSEYGWTHVRIYRASSKEGTYIQIHEQPVYDTTYHDVTGYHYHWYKLAFYNSDTGITSTFSSPMKAEQFKGYATIQEVRDFTRVTNKEFDDSAIQTMIDRATSRIDSETARTWLGYVPKTAHCDGDDSDILWLPDTDIVDVLNLEIDRDYTGRYVKVLTKNFLAYDIIATDDILTLWNAEDFPNEGIIQIGDELIEYTGKLENSLTGLVRGINGTSPAVHSSKDAVWLDNSKEKIKVYPEGYIILTRDSKVNRFPARPQSVRVRYLHGNNVIPATIKHLCLLMVAQMMNIEDPRTAEIDRVLVENKWKGPIGIS